MTERGGRDRERGGGREGETVHPCSLIRRKKAVDEALRPHTHAPAPRHTHTRNPHAHTVIEVRRGRERARDRGRGEKGTDSDVADGDRGRVDAGFSSSRLNDGSAICIGQHGRARQVDSCRESLRCGWLRAGLRCACRRMCSLPLPSAIS